MATRLMPTVAAKKAAIAAKGGHDSFYAVDYAARTASELGADVVKVNVYITDMDRYAVDAVMLAGVLVRTVDFLRERRIENAVDECGFAAAVSS